MTQVNRAGLSATQKTEIWSRWKAGQSLHEIGRAFGKGIRPFDFWCCNTAGLFPEPVGDRC